ncbi:trypsin-like peptidase domain-containing protein [Mucilaginibacter sp. JRF]|uniref:S1C family serine protease n=1 Tax=Mucilaginibacter sp. JRF TaxID=2780088 RepID=UPI00187EE26D|nr:serine protease [Mucilaginibacter sp. JRF]MBE9585096.1 trypsin-like peptidase domain-containing protein [Mucilaginibacter sp. JRF]
MSDYRLLEQIDRYINGEMSGEELANFEQLRKDNPAVDSQISEHRNFLGALKHYGERLDLEQRLNAIHEEIDVHTLHEELMIKPSWIVSLWRHHHSKISVAASIAIFAVLTTLLLTGGFKKHDTAYVELKKEIASVRTSTLLLNEQSHKIKQQLSSSKDGKTIVNPGKFSGTGFALTSNGYLVTNYHVIKGADSVYVQNVDGESFHAKVIYSEPAQDIAFLQINDASFKSLGSVPYNFKRAKSDLGEEVFTVGYPADVIAFSEGALTSPAGFNGDSSAYELSLLARPGNSGGPLLDNKGNLIGIISGKQTSYESLSFAKKSSYLLKAIQNIPSDSLVKPLNLNTRNGLAGLSRTQQIKKLRNYVFMVKVYN